MVDYSRMHRDRANQMLYESLVSGYELEIDEEAVRSAALTGTVSEDPGGR